MKRRNFIASSTAIVVSMAVPGCEYFGPLEYNPTIAEPLALSFIWDTDHIIKIGKMFQKQFPKEASERTLVKLILSDLSPDMNAPEKSIQQKIMRDYASGSIIMIDGWLLSITEARQCALFCSKQAN